MFERITQYIPALLDGALTTLTLSFTAILIGFFGGVILYLLRRTKISPIVFLVEVYVSFFRGTPMLVQLLMLFYVPPALGLDLNPYIAAISALGLNSAAYQSEILRAGFISIPFGQNEASSVVGLNQLQTFWHIELPQAVRKTLPSLISEMGDIIKASAMVSVITVTDLMRVGRQIVSVNYRPLEVYVTIGIIYLLMVTVIQLTGRKLEKKWEIKR